MQIIELFEEEEEEFWHDFADPISGSSPVRHPPVVRCAVPDVGGSMPLHGLIVATLIAQGQFVSRRREPTSSFG